MDRRTKRTHRLLGDALIDLMQEQNLNQITIRDITEHADVAYSTFFRNFESVEALLLARLNQFVEALVAELQPMRDAPYHVQSRATITALFVQLQQQPKLPHVLFQRPAAQPVLEAFKRAQVQANVMQAQQMGIQEIQSGLPLELVIHNTVVQLFGMIDWWLNQTQQPTPEEMALYYETMVLRPMWTLLLGTDGMLELLPEGAV